MARFLILIPRPSVPDGGSGGRLTKAAALVATHDDAAKASTSTEDAERGRARNGRS